MRYAFALGRVYTLSIAELTAVLERPDAHLGLAGGDVKILEASEEILIIETEKSLNVEKLQKQLGGVIKILEVIDVVKKRERDSLNFSLKHYFKPSLLKKQFFKDYKGKTQFGISVYVLDADLLKRPSFAKASNFAKASSDRSEGRPERQQNDRNAGFDNIFSQPKRLGMMIKNSLTETGASVRVVLPEFNSLSLASVVVTKNLLLQKGAEICVLAAKDKIFTAKTVSVQDFEDYGRRYYQRPTRDEKQGMIPPKVAQIMLNLAEAKLGGTILDPFCGIGDNYSGRFAIGIQDDWK